MLPAGDRDEVELSSTSCWSPVGSIVGALYHKLQIQSSAPEDGRNYRPKHDELIEIINKIIIVASGWLLYYCINDARSHKHQILQTTRENYFENFMALCR